MPREEKKRRTSSLVQQDSGFAPDGKQWAGVHTTTTERTAQYTQFKPPTYYYKTGAGFEAAPRTLV
eukprot:m.366554 g.366554  ORF g.366554 m.366554 type:complete len:66 (+) comp28096_c0_seq5:1884-2081(+)